MAEEMPEHEDDADDAAAIGDNGFEPEALQRFVDRIERLQAEIDLISLHAIEEKAPIRSDIGQVKTEAKDAGVNIKALNAILKRRRLERQAAGVDEKLDLAERAFYAQMSESLERLADQLPGLGEAARDQFKAKRAEAPF